MKIVLIAEHDNKSFHSVNHHVLTAAKLLGADVDLLIIGYQCQSVAVQAQAFDFHEIYIADANVYEHQLAENSAELISHFAKEYSYILAPASTFGKNVLPRVAALFDMGMISDVVRIIEHDIFVRPIYAGNALATVQTADPIKILTIRPTAFLSAELTQRTPVPIKKINNVFQNQHTVFEKHELTQSKRPELTAAKIIISGGRGLKSADNFHLLEKIADRLGAAIGASRAAVDAGFVPNDYQVGQTGKVVAPELYIAVGISGAIQHVAGMKDSKIIVAINNDPNAPIFEIADYGLVADLFTALPEFYEKL